MAVENVVKCVVKIGRHDKNSKKRNNKMKTVYKK